MAIVIVEAECDDKTAEVEEEEEEEGRKLCSCVFSLITSSYDGGGLVGRTQKNVIIKM